MGDSCTFALKRANLWIWESNSELLKQQSDFFSPWKTVLSAKRQPQTVVSTRDPWDSVSLDSFCYVPFLCH